MASVVKKGIDKVRLMCVFVDARRRARDDDAKDVDVSRRRGRVDRWTRALASLA